MKQLEQIVQEIETGDLSLEVSMKKFEDGIQLSRFCAKKLDETERRITLLLQNPDGTVQEAPVEDSDPLVSDLAPEDR